MRPIKVLLVDDEPLARLRLRALLQDCGDPANEVVGEAGDAAGAQALLRARPCDLVLLDIGLPGEDGMRLAAALRSAAQPPSVVFVTAHAEHALRAFELDAADYLTKPVTRERLRAALQRVAQRRHGAGEGTFDTSTQVLVVHDRGRLLRLPLADVLYLKAELKYVTLRTAAHSYVLDDALADLEQRVGDAFVRIHRNALVARAAVRALQRRRGDGESAGADEGGGEHWAVEVMPTGEWLAVSRRQLGAVREALRA